VCKRQCVSGITGNKRDLQGLRGPIVCPETSVKNYNHSLRNSPEEHSSHLLPGGNLKSLKRGEVIVLKTGIYCTRQLQ
jgi:hypothetical protein